MKKYFISGLLVLLILGLIIAGCNSQQKQTEPVKELSLGELNYEEIKETSPGFAKVAQEDLGKWYEDNYQVAGLHSFVQDNKKYLLLSAGMKPTGGYYLEDLKLVGSESEIQVTAKLHKPGKEEMVTQAITFPHILVSIEADERQLVFGGIEGNSEEVTVNKDSGRYIGQIDNNSIEIKISGVPDDIGTKAFRLDETAKIDLNKLELKENEEIGFSYYENEHSQPVIVEIHKLN